MMRDYAVQLGPETIDVRSPQALHPFRIFSPLVAALSRLRATIAALEVRSLFRIFAYGFHRLLFAYSSGSSCSGNRVGCVSFGWVGCVRYFGIEVRCQPTASCLEVLFVPDFLPLDRGWCSWRCVSSPSRC